MKVKPANWQDAAAIMTIFVAIVLGIAAGAVAHNTIKQHDERIEKLEEDKDRLIRVENDVKWIKEHLGGGH